MKSCSSVMKYKPIKEKLQNDEIGIYITCGIKVVENKQTLRIVSDVAVSYREVRKLCRRCNRLGLDIGQLDDVIEDVVAGL